MHKRADVIAGRPRRAAGVPGIQLGGRVAALGGREKPVIDSHGRRATRRHLLNHAGFIWPEC
jgi:hypothetical protein